MRYRSAYSALFVLTLCLTHVVCFAQDYQPKDHQPPVDWEQRLADQGQAQRAWTYTLNRIGMQRIQGKQKQAMIQDLITKYPGSFNAAKQSVIQLTEAGDAQQWDVYIHVTQAWLKQHHRWINPTYHVQLQMVRKLFDKEVPEQVKQQIFQTLVPWMSHRAWLASYTRNYLLNSDYTPLEQYNFARQASDAAGPSARVRAYLWTFIDKLHVSNPNAAAAACEILVKEYPQDTLQTRQASILLLQQKASEQDQPTNADVKLLQQKIKQDTDAWKSAITELLPALKATNPKATQAAVRAIIELVNQTPAYCQEALWTHLSYKTNDISTPVLTDLMRKVADKLPNAHIAEVWRKVTMDQLLGSTADIQVLLTIMSKCDDDAGRSLSLWHYVINILNQRSVNPSIRAKAYSMAAEIAEKLDAHEQASSLLFDAARIDWANNLPLAKSQLKRATATSDWTTSGVKAGWLLAFLEGNNGVSQPTSARNYNPADYVPQTLPACPLPLAGIINPSVIKTNNGWELASDNSKNDLLAGQTATASDDLANAHHVTDGDTTTAWQPATLPAVLIVPLQHQTTSACLTLTLDNPTHLAVSLLDTHGRPLARFERDWSFWDLKKTSDTWAHGQVVLNLPPVNNVSFVRLEVLDSTGPASVSMMTLTPTARRANGWLVGSTMELQDDSQSVVVDYQAQAPTKGVKYLANTEASRGYPIFNWLSPWKRTGGWINLRQYGEHMSYVFEGQNATISLLRTGGLDWQIDQGPSGHIVKLDGEQADYTLATDLPPGQHILRIGTGSMSTDENDWKSNNVFVKSINVQGQSLASPAVRFSHDGKQWGPWQQPSDTSAIPLTIAIPTSSKPRFAQAGLWLDARPTKSTQTPVVTELNIHPSHATGQTASTFQPDHVSWLKDEPNVVARLLAQRRVVVTYSKIGGDKTYKLARSIADKANVYLVSDDIGFNNYPGLVLAVGSPLRHRYTRQLLATHALWLDASYLQNTDGLVTFTQEIPGQTQTLYVMGETQGAIDAAGARLLEALDKIQQQQPTHSTIQPANSVALFPGSSLEMIYPWQLHTDRARLKDLSLRMAQNDRRSLQWGLRADRPVTSLSMRVSVLTGPDQSVLPASQVTLRYATSYEWIPFFGDLRLPNGLSSQPVLPMQANSALGMWLTVATTSDTKPGIYRGSIEVQANEQKINVPVAIHVEPVTLPRSPGIATYSFATVPYWFTPGSEVFQKAVVALATNEAEHGVNHLSLPFDVTWALTASHEKSLFVCDFSQMFKQIAWCDEVYRQRGLPLPVYISQVKSEGTLISQSLDGGKTDRVYECSKEMGSQLLAALKKAGMADRFMLKVGDEPRPNELQKWADMAKPFHDAGLRTMTCHNTSYPDMSIAIGLMNPWVPNYEHDLNLSFLRERQKKGDALWWYVCGVPPTRLTGKPVDNLPFYWLTAKWHLQGAMNYAAMHTSEFSTPVPFRYEQGLDHRIMFLADGSVMDTTRRELENDGIRDEELIALIQRQITKLPKQKATSMTRRLDALLQAIVPYKYRYETRPEKWETARDTLYDMAIESSETNVK